jgi:hypothetical protein
MYNIFGKVTDKDLGMYMTSRIKVHIIFFTKDIFKDEESVRLSLQTLCQSQQDKKRASKVVSLVVISHFITKIFYNFFSVS